MDLVLFRIRTIVWLVTWARGEFHVAIKQEFYLVLQICLWSVVDLVLVFGVDKRLA